jgi:hypothetical protein
LSSQKPGLHPLWVCSWYLGGKSALCILVRRGARNLHRFFTKGIDMSKPLAGAAAETREQRIEAIMKELRPKIDEQVRKMVERAVDVPEAEEFGAIDFEFRDAGLNLAKDVRQASVASRKKRGT